MFIYGFDTCYFHIIMSALVFNRQQHLNLVTVINNNHGEKIFLTGFSSAMFWRRIQPFKRQPHKMVKHTQNSSSAIADKLFECVWPFCGVGA